MKYLKDTHTHTHTNRGHAHKHALIHTHRHRHRHRHEAAQKRDMSTESQWPVTTDLNACQYEWTAEQLFPRLPAKSDRNELPLLRQKHRLQEHDVFLHAGVEMTKLRKLKKKKKRKKSQPSPLRSNGKLQDTCLGRWSLPLNLNLSKCKHHRYPHLPTALPVRNRVVPSKREKRRRARQQLLYF